MYLQDVHIKNSSAKAHTMFDNGSELTLISSIFAKENNLPYEEASVTISSVRVQVTTFNSGDYRIFYY